jgi:3-dehydroquinate dehydratase-2
MQAEHMTGVESNTDAGNQKKNCILMLNGPNLNMLGRRDPEKYGSFTLADVVESARLKAAEYGYQMTAYQSNHEGDLIDKIHEMMDCCSGILLNAGAFTHYSYALRDAIELCPVPVIEIHISDIMVREDFRRISVINPVCVKQFSGFGMNSYLMGLDYLVGYLSSEGEAADVQK